MDTTTNTIVIDRLAAVKINKAFTELYSLKFENKVLYEYINHKDSTISLLFQQIQNYEKLDTTYQKAFKELSQDFMNQNIQLQAYTQQVKQQRRRTIITHTAIAVVLGALILIK